MKKRERKIMTSINYFLMQYEYIGIFFYLSSVLCNKENVGGKKNNGDKN